MKGLNATVAIDARPFSGPDVYTGTTVYLKSIIRPLLDAGYQVTLLSNRPILKEHADIADNCEVAIFGRQDSMLKNKLDFGLWELLDLPKYLNKTPFDVYFCGSNRGIPYKKNKLTRYIAGILDIIPFKFASHYLPRYKFHFIRKEIIPFLLAVWRADEVVTISDSSANDIKKLFHKRSVTHLPFNLAPAPLQKKPVAKKQFIYIGGENPRKKVDSLLEAFASFKEHHPDYTLLLVGKAYDPYIQMIKDLGLADSVTITGYIDEEQKYRELAASVALVYPSLYEGYGLDAAEAIQVGTPVICGTGGSQREIVGKAGIYIDPTSAQDIEAAMNRMLNPSLRKEFIELAAKQAAVLENITIQKKTVDYFGRQAQLARGEHE